MSFRRRILVATAAAAASLWSFGALAQAQPQAQDYPSRPIRIVVPFPAGGTTDIITRIIGQKLSEEWKQPVVVDNRPGGGANIGAENAVRSAPDGYTLLMASTAHSINATLYPKMTYDPVKDFTPIIVAAETAQVLVVHPSVPANNVRELIAYLKSRPTPVNYSSAGNGSQPHLSTEMFKGMSGTQMTHVPYKGGPQAIQDLLAGHVLVSLATAPSAVPHVKSGKVKALGVSSRQRIPALPDVPTITESGLAGYEASGFFGLVGPAGMSPAITDKIHAAVLKILKDPAVAKQLSEQGADPAPSASPAEYAAFLRTEVAKWGKVVKDTGATID